MSNKLLKLFSIISFYRARSIVIIFRQLLYMALRWLTVKKYVLKNIYDYKMFLPLRDDGLGRVLFVLGERELDHKWLMDNEVMPDDRVLDLGANIGYYAVMEAMKLSGSGHIYAVEPDPRNVRVLKKNIALNNFSSIIDFKQGAISNHNGTAMFGLHKRTNLNSFNILDSKNTDVEQVEVEIIDFSDYLKEIGGVDLVRMDVEGHELEILQSLSQMMLEDAKLAPRTIIFETHCYKIPELMAETISKLLELGYRAKYITSDDELKNEGSILVQYGYRPNFVISEWGVSRGIYQDIETNDAIELISNWAGTRTVCLEYAN